MTIPWGTPPEPPKYEPPEGYKLVKIKPLYQRAVFWVPVVAILAVIGMAAAWTLPKGTAADAAVSGPPSTSHFASRSPSAVSSRTAAAPGAASTRIDGSTTAEARPTKTTGTIGDPAPVAWSSDDTGMVTVYSAKWVKPDADSFVQPDNGAYLVVDIGYVSTTGTVSYNPLYWSLRDVDGREYDATVMPVDGYSPQLQSGDLAPGAKARGFVAFDAPQQAFTLEVGAVLGGALMTWDMPAA